MTAHIKNTAHLFLIVHPETKTYNFYTYTKYYYKSIEFFKLKKKNHGFWIT